MDKGASTVKMQYSLQKQNCLLTLNVGKDCIDMSRQLQQRYTTILVAGHSRHKLTAAFYHFLELHCNIDDAHIVWLQREVTMVYKVLFYGCLWKMSDIIMKLI